MGRALIALTLVAVVGAAFSFAPVFAGPVTQPPNLAEAIAQAKTSVVRVHTGAQYGSGVIIDGEGHILTNAHVVEGGMAVWVKLSDGRWGAGTVTARNESKDLAIVAIAGGNLSPIALGQSSKLRVGDEVVAIGYPLALA